jgi:hypothetical protein
MSENILYLVCLLPGLGVRLRVIVPSPEAVNAPEVIMLAQPASSISRLLILPVYSCKIQKKKKKLRGNAA